MGRKNGTAESLPVKNPKRGRRVEEMTVFVLSCDGRYALCKRPDTGLLAGLWEFPHMPGKLSAVDAINSVEQIGLKPKDIKRQVEKKHIFTHIEWRMRGIYMEVAGEQPSFAWLTREQIEKDAALPTAFRQFWEETEYV